MVEFIQGLLVFGGFAFWAFIAFIALLMFVSVEKESGLWATGTLAGALALLYFFGDISPVTAWLSAHWPIAIPIYFGVGTAWAVAKWWFYLRNRRERVLQLKTEFQRSNNISTADIPESLRRDWYSYAGSYASVPQASDNKSRIMLWIGYWPFSMLWTLISDPVMRVLRAVYNSIGGLLQRMSDAMFKDVESDMRK